MFKIGISKLDIWGVAPTLYVYLKTHILPYLIYVKVKLPISVEFTRKTGLFLKRNMNFYFATF